MLAGMNATAARHFTADQLRFQAFALRDELHLFGNETLPREMHLRHVPLPFAVAAAASRFSIQTIAQAMAIPVTRVPQPEVRAATRFLT